MKNICLDILGCRALGDTLCATPTLRKLYNSYGKKISVITHHPELFYNNPYVLEVFDDSKNKEIIHSANKALRTYLSTLIGISNELAQSLTTTRFFEYNTQNKLSEDGADITKESFNLLDSLIFGKQIHKDTFQKVKKCLEEVVRLTGMNK